MISILPYKPVEKYKPSTSKDYCGANKLFKIDREENNKEFFLLNLLNLQREQQMS